MRRGLRLSLRRWRGSGRTECEEVSVGRVDVGFRNVDVVSLYARQVEVAEYWVEGESAAGRARADERGCGSVSVNESSDSVCWPCGAGRREHLATSWYLAVGEKDRVVGDARA